MMLLEGPARFMLELIRVEPAVLVGHLGKLEVNMSLSMILGLVIFAGGVIFWLSVSLANKRQPQVG